MILYVSNLYASNTYSAYNTYELIISSLNAAMFVCIVHVNILWRITGQEMSISLLFATYRLVRLISTLMRNAYIYIQYINVIIINAMCYFILNSFA